MLRFFTQNRVVTVDRLQFYFKYPQTLVEKFIIYIIHYIYNKYIYTYLFIFLSVTTHRLKIKL